MQKMPNEDERKIHKRLKDSGHIQELRWGIPDKGRNG
jgi:hypothetical protein